jgi:hypothetical protein
MEVRKKSRHATSNVGEFVTLITTSAPARICSRPSPVIRSTPWYRAAGTASWLARISF